MVQRIGPLITALHYGHHLAHIARAAAEQYPASFVRVITLAVPAQSRQIGCGDAQHGSQSHLGLGNDDSAIVTPVVTAQLQTPPWCARVEDFPGRAAAPCNIRRAAGFLKNGFL